MKAWMKVMLWLGLGGGIGFFAGWQARDRMGERQEARTNTDKAEEEEEGWEEYEVAIHKYRADTGDISDDGEDHGIPETVEIPQMHPTHIAPVQITEEEFNYNEDGYDIHHLIWYVGDEVLYDETDEKVIPEIENEVGYGMIDALYGDPTRENGPVYAKNDTFGRIYRIDKSPEAFCEAVDGTAPGPREYDDDEDAEMPDMDELGIDDEEEDSEGDLD